MKVLVIWLILIVAMVSANAGFAAKIAPGNSSQAKQGGSPQAAGQGHSPSKSTAIITFPGGQQIGWQVVASGATKIVSANHILEGTAGQTAIGRVVFGNLEINQGYWQVFALPCKAGDADGNNDIDISDAIYLINFIFTGGDTPDPICLGDSNGDGMVDISDAVALLTYIFVH